MAILNADFLTKESFQTYCTFLALKRHFSSSYDYFKYQGKTKASYESFKARRDAYVFHKLSKHHNSEQFILSNIVKDPKCWSGTLIDDSAKQTYLDWRKRVDSLSYHLIESLEFLDENYFSNFEVKNGHYPLVVDLFLQHKISLETLTILSHVSNSIAYWKAEVSDTVLFPDILMRVQKYHPFLNYSQGDIKKIIKNHFFAA